MIWKHESSIGTIFIVYDSNSKGFYIVFDDYYYGKYLSAIAAADDVYTFSTGCVEWDDMCMDMDFVLETPTDINEWERIK